MERTEANATDMSVIHEDDAVRRGAEPASAARALRANMLASDRVLLAADEAHLRAALDSVRWERRGLLQRLTRSRR